jgi:hypothetical protein
MKKKKKQEEIKAGVHPITIADLAEERKQEVKCQNPIKLGWTIYAVAAILYILNGLTANLVVDLIPEKAPIVSTLNNYKQTEEYNDYIAETQKQATNKLTNGEITVEEYNFIIETLSSDEKFEEFLRLIDGDEFVKQTITDYDEYKNKMNTVGKAYAGVSIASLSSVLIATLILAKYRMKEMDIEEKRKKRAKELGIDLEQFEQ